MHADEQTYRNVAKHCSSYTEKDICRCTNKTGDSERSCSTCQHFSSDRHCTLDLFEPIVANHGL